MEQPQPKLRPVSKRRPNKVCTMELPESEPCADDLADYGDYAPEQPADMEREEDEEAVLYSPHQGIWSDGTDGEPGLETDGLQSAGIEGCVSPSEGDDEVELAAEGEEQQDAGADAGEVPDEEMPPSLGDSPFLTQHEIGILREFGADNRAAERLELLGSNHPSLIRKVVMKVQAKLVRRLDQKNTLSTLCHLLRIALNLLHCIGKLRLGLRALLCSCHVARVILISAKASGNYLRNPSIWLMKVCQQDPCLDVEAFVAW